ncbi:hypothetical protein NQD34_006646 [Periophthalmus magnuspinnatus]|nr:hypothetical protein NQD34_006646 [Periophthalmus magnuspinnatus]
MSAGTVVIAGAVLAAVILLTIVGVLCLCRLQYYCCKREESEKADNDGEAEFSTMTRPLALSAPPTPPTPDLNTPDSYPPTFLTEANGPSCCTPPPPPPPPQCHRAHYCPTCTRPVPFCLQRPTCSWDGRNLCYRSFQQHHVELPLDISTLYRKLQLLTMREVSHHSVSTDV